MKRRFNRASAAVISAGIAITFAASAIAHTGATGIVKERMDLMSRIGDAMKVLSSTFKKERPYDAAEVAGAAETIRDHSGEAMTKLFPKGSLKHPSVAREEIWKKWQDFERLSEDLKAYSAALAAAAPKGNADGMPHGAGTGGMMGKGMPSGGMMGQGMMGGDAARPDASMLAAMPPSALFAHVAETCSSCHSQFRTEKKH